MKNSGILYTFVQCEDRMWRLNEREMPDGLRIESGSDWFCLHYDFIEYILNSKDEYLLQLKSFFQLTLLPSEVYLFIKLNTCLRANETVCFIQKTFFHMVIVNSPFCNKVVNNNLKHISWNRQMGCTCSYYHVVDCK